MKLSTFMPTFQQVLFKIERDEKIEMKSGGGLYLPGLDFKLTDQKEFFEEEKVIYDGSKSKLNKLRVLKVASEVTEVKAQDLIILDAHAFPVEVDLEEGTFYLVAAQRVIGREPKPSTMDDFTIQGPREFPDTE